MNHVRRIAAVTSALLWAALGSPALSETVLVVPAAAHASGAAGTLWTTELSLFNPSPSASARITVRLLPRAGEPGTEGSVDVLPRRGVTLPDIVGSLGASGGGALRLSSESPFVASSRTFNGGSPVCGTFGVAVPAVPLSAAVTRGLLHGLSGARVNAGLVNDGEAAVSATLRILDATSGAVLGTSEQTVEGRSSLQVDDLLRSLAPSAPAMTQLAVEVSASSPLLAWATPIDGTSGDGSFLLAVPDAGAAAGAAGWWESWFTLPLPSGWAFRVEDGLRYSGSAGVPRIVPLPDGRVRLYTPGQSGLKSATSTDGLTFVPDAGTRGPMTDCAVVYLAAGGYRFLWPDGPNGNQILKSATSPDGLLFTIESGERFRPGPGDAGISQVPHVIRLADDRWRLSYVADWFGTGGAGPRNNTRTAISTDEGLTWSVENPAATGADTVDPDVVRVEDGSYRLYYKHHAAFRAATSPDGFAYPSSGEAGRTVLDAAERFDPAVIRFPDGTIRVYFGTPAGVGSAVATDTGR